MMKRLTKILLLILALTSGVLVAQTSNTPKAKTIKVTSPNGGELWQIGTSQTILWSSTEISTVNVQYSINSGVSWTTIASNVIASLGKYVWAIDSTTVPPSQEARIRIVDAGGSGIFDISDSNFILSELRINSPKIGSVFQTGRATAINWFASSDIATVTIQYSVNGGTSWNTIAAGVNANDNTYLWDVNIVSSNRTKIRIYDDAHPATIIATSPNFIAADLSLISPIGGESWRAGSTHVISWNSSYITYVKLEYSVDGGPWIEIADSVSGGVGSYGWQVPDVLSSQVLVRISHSGNSNVYDQSSSTFTVLNLKITSPDGGEGWEIGIDVPITWTTNLSGNIDIDLSTDGGATYTESIASNISSGLNTYTYTAPNTPTGEAKVKISSSADSSILDESHENFTIGSVTVTAPVGGENWLAGQPHNISWTNTTGIDVVGIDYTTDDGTTWNTIVSAYPAGLSTYTWFIPNGLFGGNVKVRVYDSATGIGKKHKSNSFSIATLQISSPLNGAIFKWGDNVIINWTASSNISNVAIDYSSDGGTNWILIQNNIAASTGTYSWTIPNGLSSDQMKIRVRDESNENFANTNPGYFTVGNISVLTPNGGEKIVGGISYPITWSATNSIGQVRIEYSVDGGATYTNIPGASAVDAQDESYNWHVPNISTSQARVRISDATTANILDASDNDFSIGILQITSPNGGEGFSPNQTTNITWNSDRVTQLLIEFSTDGGGSWTTIASGVDATLGTYSWTIPTSYTNSGLIRISDLSNSSNFDLSGSYFAIGNISVTYPNGRTILQAGKTYNITYDYSSNINSVDIELSTDNGTSWSPIVNNTAATGSYSWMVGQIHAANAFVRVLYHSFTDIYDDSDNDFKIELLQLGSPNGSNYFLVDSVATVTWTSRQIANLKIEYSTDNGAIWQTVVASTPALPQSYDWTIPNTPSTNTLLRLSDADNPSIEIADTSASVFTINLLYMVSPNGGENYIVNDNAIIRWLAYSSLATVRLEYSTNSGTSWNPIASNITASDKQYTWTIPNAPTNRALVRIVDETNSSVLDASNNYFSIGSILLTSPNGGEKWQVDSVKTITWQNIATIANVKLYYSINSGTTWNLIQQNVDATAERFDWTVPDSVTSRAMVRIENSTDSTINDESDGTFSIANITITYPNGGEFLQAGDVLPILWQSYNVDNATIQYSDDNGVTWQTITNNVQASLGQYNWTIPNSLSTTTFLIRIIDNDFNTVHDISDATANVFYLTVSSPNGSEAWNSGTVKSITWNSGGISKLDIDYSTNSGQSWTSITTGISASGGSYSWSIPSSLFSDSMLVKFTDSSHPGIKDSSDNLFVVGDISITEPISSTVWQTGSVQPIKWSSAGVQSLKIEISFNGGTTWSQISPSYGAGSGVYYYNVPNNSTANAKIRLTDVRTGSEITETSQTFTINNLSLTYPTSSSLWIAGDSYTITWNSSNIVNLGIDYSTDEGTTWNAVTASTPASTGSYNWTIPDSLSTDKAKIRIFDVDNNAAIDSSENFTIGAVSIEMPISSTVWQSGKTYKINWAASSSISQVNVEYSTNNGTSWNTISTNVTASDSSVFWTIPNNMSTSTARIRVSHVNSNFSSTDAIYDISQAFTLVNLSLTSPTNATNWQARSAHNITWSGSSLINTISIFYSTNLGQTWNTIVSGVNMSDGSYLWSVPNLTSDSVLVLLRSDQNSGITDSLTSPFKISDLSVTNITSSTEWQSGTVHEIDWNSENLQSIDIQYSTDNGSTWKNIISGIAASIGKYNWTLPQNISSAQTIVRISSSSDPTILFDTPLFTIKYLTVTSPNGNENWQVGNNETITWNSGLVNNIRIDLSTDNGTNWINISTPISASNGSYSWNVPDTISTVAALVRIIDLDNSTIRDSSDANFTIGRLVLTSPVGREVWQTNTLHAITWSSINVNSVQLEYSTDNGTTWNNIVNSVNANSQNYNWLIPTGIASNNSLVRITSLDDPSVNYTSNIFTIVDLNIVSPNGGEVYQSGSQHYIKWTSSNISQINIYFSSDNGTNWENIVSNFNATADSLLWTVPSSVSTNQALMKIIDSSDSTHYDVSNNNFSIHSFQITSPVGGEQWQIGKSYNVTWTASSNISTVSLEYSLDNGTTWNSFAANITASLGTYSWLIPSGTASSQAKVRILDDNSSLVSAGGVFTISDLQLVSPAGSEFWTNGNLYNITWTASQITNVKIEYSPDNGASWETLSNSETATNGSYGWNIPGTYSTSQGLIRISDASNPEINAANDNNFTIGRIIVNYPNGGEILQAGQPVTISWNSTPADSLFNIDYSTDNGVTWNSVVSFTDSASSYTWNIPSTISSGTALIRVSNALSSGAIVDRSDAVFTINMLNIISPNGGEDLLVGATQSITWNSGNNIANVKLDYYTPSAGWQPIVASVTASNGSYNWTIPNVPSDSVKVRVVSTVDNSISDESDAYLRIASVNFTSPLTTTKWQAGDTETLTWINSSNVNKVNLFYKIGTGTWTGIAMNIDASQGSYLWKIPDVSSQQIYLRIEDYSAPSSIYDETSFANTISNLAITVPTGSTVWIAGSTQEITWTASTDIRKISINYSIDKGTTWVPMADSVAASTEKYSWTIPNSINTDSVLVKISDIDFANVNDTSNFFKISNAQLVLLSPIGGEYWQSGKDHNITWNLTSNISLVNIYYSTNSGSSWSRIQANYPASNKSYTYSVPANFATDSLRIKIEDATNTFIADSSSQDIFVRWINLLSPIGGEHLQANQPQNISWSASSNMTNIRIDFSADGTGWNTLGTVPATTNSYNWLVNNIPTDSGYIRISDANSNLAIKKISNPFSISMFNLTSPINGGEYQTGDSVAISWINSSDITSVQMEYTTDRTNWFTINTSPVAASDSTYYWILDNSVCGDSIYIRAFNFAYQTIADTTTKPITVKQLSLVEPAAGQNWRVGTTHQIKWQYCGVDSVSLQYSLNKGASWIDISDAAASSLAYNWLIPNTISDSVKVRVYDKINQNIKSESGYFSIFQSVATLTYPVGGEFFQAGDTTVIRWTSSLVNYFKVELSIDNAATWSIISNATLASDDSLLWAVPDTLESDQCLIKLTDLENPEVSDSSKNVFTVARLKLINPVGGEYIPAGTTLPITWNASSYISNVKLYYSLDNGTIWNTIQGASNLIASTGTFSWNVPNNLSSDSTQIKIESVQHPTVYSVSKIFTTGWVKILSPNGGEVFLSGKSFPVTWSNGNSIKRVLVEVINAKTNLILLSEIDSAKTGASQLTLPSGLVSDSMFIRISDVRSNYSIIDSSDNFFTTSVLEFTSPNSSTNWNSGSTHLIEWNSGDFLGNINVEYSLNAGQTWRTVKNNIAANRDSLTWHLPADVNTNSCLIRGYNPNINTVADTTDNFTIFTSQLSLIAPNGGEKLEAGSQYNIKWASAFITNLQIEVSYNNGASWDTLTSAAIGDDSLWGWNVPPQISTEQALIRLRNTVDSTQVVTSVSPFSVGWVKVTSPSVGAHWIATRKDTIAWDASSSVHKVNLLYTLNGNTADSNLVLIDANINALDSTYVWTLPSIESSHAKIVVRDAESNDLISDESGSIKISKIQLLTPNGNEFIQAGAPYTITWNVTAATIPYINIDYSLDGGTHWGRLASSASSADSSFSWNIGSGISTDSALVKITDATNVTLTDTSDNFFSIGGLELTVFNSPEKVLVGSVKKLSWTRTDNIAKVSLYYKTKDGVWKSIALNYPADSTYYDWTIPDDVSDSCFVKINDVNNPLLFDVSNAPFFISNLKIVNMNGGGVYQTGKDQEITWSSSFINFINLQYSTDSLNWTNINTAPVVADSAKYTWSIPDDINLASPNYLLRIVDTDYPNIADTSNSNFTVSYIKMKKPNGGEGEQIGTSYTIEWASSNSTIQNVNLYVELQSGSDVWTPIANNIDASSGTYYWLISTQATPSARMKVEDANNHSIFDISDSSFVISHIQLTTPNGGDLEKLQVGKQYEIKWESQYINNIGISYSVNDGNTWNFAGAAPGDSGKFIWTVPNVPTDQARIKLQDFDYPNVFDISDTNFSIVSIRVTNPNNYEAVNANSTYNITWTSSYLDSVRILLSTDGGTSFPVLVAITDANSGSYNWNVPNTPTADARIKITDIYTVDVSDKSDTTFLIGVYPTLTPIGNSQSGIVKLLYSLPNANETVDLTSFTFKTIGGSENDGFSYLQGSYQNLVGPLVDTIKWNSKGQLDNFEGPVVFNANFHSTYRVDYKVSADTIVLDNKAPQFDPASIVVSQNPFEYGWSKAIANWSTASDTSKPIKYELWVSDSNIFDTLPSAESYGTQAVLQNIQTSTNYHYKLKVSDSFGNYTEYLKTNKSMPLADFNNDGLINGADLAAYVYSWDTPDSSSGADMYPYSGSTPIVTVTPDDNLNINDLLVFRDMWNYYAQNRGLPKKTAINFADADSRELIKFKKGENKFTFDFDLGSENLTALSAEIAFNPEVFKFDSLKFNPETESMDNIVLAYEDSVKGIIRVDFASLSGRIGSKYSIVSNITADLNRNNPKDSILIKYLGYDKKFNAAVNGAKVYTLQEVPNKFALYQNYPNPFNPVTTIEFDVPAKVKVLLKVYNILGQEVATLVNKVLDAGAYKTKFSSYNQNSTLASGVYFYRIVAGKYISTKKMVILK